jgi:DME family drug/metabolite transporter
LLRLLAFSKGFDRLSVFAAAFLFSTGGAAIKASSLSSWQVAGFRSGIAAIVLYALLPGARRGWTWRTGAIGLAYAATLILFVAANKLTTSANAIFLQSTAPFYLLIFGPLVLREPIRRADLAVISAVAAGAVLLLLGSENAALTAPDPVRGNLLALVAGFTWALTITGLRWAAKRESNFNTSAAHNAGTAAVIAGNLIAFFFCFPAAVPGSFALTGTSLIDAGIVLYLGIFQVSLAYIFLTRSLRHIRGLEAATLLLIEPVLNPFWTWAIHGERPGPLALLGGAMIILAAFAGTAWQAKFTPISQL